MRFQGLYHARETAGAPDRFGKFIICSEGPLSPTISLREFSPRTFVI